MLCMGLRLTVDNLAVGHNGTVVIAELTLVSMTQSDAEKNTTEKKTRRENGGKTVTILWPSDRCKDCGQDRQAVSQFSRARHFWLLVRR